MNKIMKLGLGLLVTLAMFACSENNIPVRELDEITDADLIRSIKETGEKGIPFPDGSTLDKKNDDNYIINLPDGYFYVVKDGSSSKLLSAVRVTCNCTVGKGGCSPVAFEGTYYCVMESGCQTCTMNISGVESSIESTNILGLANKNAGITLVSDKKIPKYQKGDLINNEKIIKHKDVIHGNAFPELFEMKEVKKYFKELGEGYKDNSIKPNSYAFLNVYGNLMLVPYLSPGFSFAYEVDGVTYEVEALVSSSGSISCNCDDESNGCVKQKKYIPFVGTGYYCKAGSCTKCTLIDGAVDYIE